MKFLVAQIYYEVSSLKSYKIHKVKHSTNELHDDKILYSKINCITQSATNDQIYNRIL
jgi:hypothetical protein